MCLHTLPNRSNQKPQSGLIYRLIMTLQCATVKNSPSKLEGVPEGGGSVAFAAKYFLVAGFYVLFHFLAVKSGAKSGAMINFRGQANKIS